MKWQNMSELDMIQSGLIDLHRASFQYRAWEVLQKNSGVTLDKASVALLKVLRQPGSYRMHDIAQALAIEAPSVTRKVQDLELEGLIKKTADPSDKRAAVITITGKGKTRLAKLEQARRAQLASALESWSAKDRRTFAKLLTRFSDSLNRVTNTNLNEHKDTNAKS